MDICQINLITVNKKFLLVVPDTISETLLSSTLLLSTKYARNTLHTSRGRL